jgi:hypothetical protein
LRTGLVTTAVISTFDTPFSTERTFAEALVTPGMVPDAMTVVPAFPWSMGVTEMGPLGSSLVQEVRQNKVHIAENQPANRDTFI